ncbi:uncharacterized protein MONOS_14351 [Monocercomonoides exilis]|uniref:uncharacterized protein n=1 Tax=Monocercomonoides exilis TaxID=2049356 RepID=UPI00355A7AD4|nr:hypothetical protein MONOS_14351 [Monocercomonoides exilis]|eukprot:MONOS_14351.1-p1 / transcript=MONOS_14351.1 / gene=MONOS_14351 / organism=Monocercomonoides_exilis_PA203 / gene_product=unspecified product / transcript_product=unspecified product / location=Mono_scaffold00986:12923-13786(+) / protein_length=166 / sequence_SO=supercontig / SO=protein_coding / is_pseudo=false
MLFHHQHLHQHLLPLSSSSSSSSTPLTTRMPSAHRSTPADVISHSHLELSRSAAIATAKFESRLAGLPLEHTKSRSEADNTRFVYDAFYDSVICEQSVRLYEDDAALPLLGPLGPLDPLDQVPIVAALNRIASARETSANAKRRLMSSDEKSYALPLELESKMAM